MDEPAVIELIGRITAHRMLVKLLIRSHPDVDHVREAFHNRCETYIALRLASGTPDVLREGFEVARDELLKLLTGAA